MRWIPYEAFSMWFQKFGYTPGPSQERSHRVLLEPCEVDGGPAPRIVVITGGEQAGKSLCAGNHAAALGLTSSIGWLLGQRYADCRREFEYARDAALKAGWTSDGMYSQSDEGPWEIRYHFRLEEDFTPVERGCVIKTLTTEDATKVSQESPDFIILCEAGRQSHQAFRYALRRAFPKSAPLLITGTLEDDAEGWLADLYRTCEAEGNPYNGTAISLPSHENLSLYPGGEEGPKFQNLLRILRETNLVDAEEEIGERFYGRPRTPKGLVFSDFSPQYHVSDKAEYIPGKEVLLAVDPGWFPSAYAILFCQIVGEQFRVFDEIYVHRQRTSEILATVKNHYSFQDLTEAWFDPFAVEQHSQGQDSTYESWRAGLTGRNIALRWPERFKEEDGRLRLHDKLLVNPLYTPPQPYLLVHSRAKWLTWEMTKGYRLRQRNDGTFASDEPIDRDNHAIKALIYAIMGRYGIADHPNRRRPEPTVQTPHYLTAFQRRSAAVGGRR